MRIVLISVGRLRTGPERDLSMRYLERLGGLARSIGITGVDVKVVDESRARRPDDRKSQEARAIRGALPADATRAALDQRGQTMTSEDFAKRLGRERDGGTPAFAVLIGGPDGLSDECCTSAELVIAFGAMTWPHQLVRVLAAEQLYRAATILAGLPYHRG